VTDPGYGPNARQASGCVPCLRSVDAGALDELCRSIGENVLPRGTVVARQGESFDGILIVVAGRIKLQRVTEHGRSQILKILEDRSCFCMSPLERSLLSPVTAECMVESRVVVLRGERLRRVLGEQGTFLSGVVRCLSARVADMMCVAAGSSVLTVRQRLAGSLIDLADRSGTPTADGVVVEGYSHEDLAAITGTAREVVSRTLRQLQAEGIVRSGRRRLFVKDLGRLAVAAGRPS